MNSTVLKASGTEIVFLLSYTEYFSNFIFLLSTIKKTKNCKFFMGMPILQCNKIVFCSVLFTNAKLTISGKS